MSSNDDHLSQQELSVDDKSLVTELEICLDKGQFEEKEGGAELFVDSSPAETLTKLHTLKLAQKV
jgi:hypothetical protein